jgi:hypothetical protein
MREATPEGAMTHAGWIIVGGIGAGHPAPTAAGLSLPSLHRNRDGSTGTATLGQHQRRLRRRRDACQSAAEMDADLAQDKLAFTLGERAHRLLPPTPQERKPVRTNVGQTLSSVNSPIPAMERLTPLFRVAS